MIRFYIISFKGMNGMQKSKWNDYSYTILLCLSMVLAFILWIANAFWAEKAENIGQFFYAELDSIGGRVKDEALEFIDLFMPGQILASGTENETAVKVDAEVLEPALSADGTQKVELPENLALESASDSAQTGASEVTADAPASCSSVIGSEEQMELENDMAEALDAEMEEAPVIFHADISYFDDALFIGDSRTVGLYEYGGLGNAEVFADTGMNIYKVFEQEFELRNKEKVTLEKALQTMKFGKVYIMLGINELGYDFEQTVACFSETIDTILKYQPEAVIFIQANLHITKEKSEESEYFTNNNIDKYNSAISELANEKQIFYLDANPLYDDEEGCLSTEFTTDHAHILGKYYVDWVDFILQNAVRG